MSPREANPEGEAGEEEESHGCSGSDEEGLGLEILHDGPVPRVSMGYFYLSKRGLGRGVGGQAMSTKELQQRLREIGKSARGSRGELIKRYDKEVQGEEPEKDQEEKSSSSARPPKSHASENPMMVMVDESTGN